MYEIIQGDPSQVVSTKQYDRIESNRTNRQEIPIGRKLRIDLSTTEHPHLSSVTGTDPDGNHDSMTEEPSRDNELPNVFLQKSRLESLHKNIL